MPNFEKLPYSIILIDFFQKLAPAQETSEVGHIEFSRHTVKFIWSALKKSFLHFTSCRDAVLFSTMKTVSQTDEQFVSLRDRQRSCPKCVLRAPSFGAQQNRNCVVLCVSLSTSAGPKDCSATYSNVSHPRDPSVEYSNLRASIPASHCQDSVSISR